jgi:hypothetical protein
MIWDVAMIIIYLCEDNALYQNLSGVLGRPKLTNWFLIMWFLFNITLMAWKYRRNSKYYKTSNQLCMGYVDLF